MEQYNYIMHVLIIIFEIYMLNEFGVNLLGGNTLSPRILVMTYAVFILVLVGINDMGNTTVNLLVVPIVFALFASIKFQGSLIKRILTSCYFYIICIGPEIIFAVINHVKQNDGYQFQKTGDINTYIMLFAMKGLTYIIIKWIGQQHRSREYSKVRNGVFYELMIFPLSTFCLFLSIFYADIKVSGKSLVMLVIAASLILFSNVYMFHVFDMLIEANKAAKKVQLLNLKSSIEEKNYHKLEQINSRYRVLLHDVNKYLRIIGELSKNGGNQEVYDLFEKMGVKLYEGEEEFFAKNSVLNAILNEIKSQAEDWNISYIINVDLDVTVEFIDELDLIAILENLLDNALEAAKQVEDRGYASIHMYMSNEGSFLCIDVKNNFSEVPITKNNRFITTKKNKEYHGIGLATVQELVEKYGGMMQIIVEENVFRVSIAMSVNKKTSMFRN